MFEFVKKVFFAGLVYLSSFTSVNTLSCISMNNQACEVRPKIINVNRNKPAFFDLFSIKTSKCSNICSNINDPYAKICVPDVAKNLNVTVFNLMSITNETRHIKWHETCKCKCRLDSSVCNNKQCWNDDKCRCTCKELIDKGVCIKGFIWNPSNCECECDKSCVGEYLDYKNCKCRERLADKLTEECTEIVKKMKLAKITLAKNEFNNKCGSCKLYIVLFSILFKTNIGISTYFVYWHWYLKKDVPRIKFNTHTHTTV